MPRITKVGGLVILGVILLCVGVLFGIIGADERRPYYESALGKWRSQNIIEYEAEVKQVTTDLEASGSYRLRVRDGQIASAYRYGVPVPVDSDSSMSLVFKDITAEGMFDRVDYLTSHNPFGHDKSCSFDFDTILGYPSRFDCTFTNYSRTGRITSTNKSSTVITSLKVLQRATPSP